MTDDDGVWGDEERGVAEFMAGGCSCNHGPNGSPCHKMLSAVQYHEMRDECRELSRQELDLVIMGELRALTARSSRTWRETERVRSHTKFLFSGQPVCLTTFCFLHCIGRGKFTATKSSWLQNGLRPQQHTCVTPHNATSYTEITRVVHFILQYAEDHGILLPGRVPGYKRNDLQLLPSHTTKRDVWQLYYSALEEDHSHAVCYSLFCRLWKQLTPQVVVTRPMSDLCWTCQRNSNLIMRSHNQPLEEKTEV